MIYCRFFILIISTCLIQGLLLSQQPWIAPSTAKSLKNPIADNTQSLSVSIEIFKVQCLMCHGKKGKGDGFAGVAITPRPADFTKSVVQNQSDGEIYWKLSNGRAPMAGYKEILSEKELWGLVNYIRSLKK